MARLAPCARSGDNLGMTAGFILDPRLAADTAPVSELFLSRVLLMNDARFPWLILVPRRPGVSDIVDLDESARMALMREISQAASALRRLHRPHKLNVAALGNQVAQLHVHVIARFRGDSAWPGPVWGVGDRQSYAPARLGEIAASCRAALGG